LTALDTLDSQLNHIAHGLFERRPVLRLVGREFQSCLERRNSRIGECGGVFGSQMMVLMFGAGTAIAVTTTVVRTLLRIDKGRAGESKDCCRGD
jgi:hypothetical protein